MKRNRARPGNPWAEVIGGLQEFTEQRKAGRSVREICRITELRRRPDGSFVRITTDPVSPGIVKLDQVS